MQKMQANKSDRLIDVNAVWALIIMSRQHWTQPCVGIDLCHVSIDLIAKKTLKRPYHYPTKLDIYKFWLYRDIVVYVTNLKFIQSLGFWWLKFIYCATLLPNCVNIYSDACSLIALTYHRLVQKQCMMTLLDSLISNEMLTQLVSNIFEIYEAYHGDQ